MTLTLEENQTALLSRSRTTHRERERPEQIDHSDDAVLHSYQRERC